MRLSSKHAMASMALALLAALILVVLDQVFNLGAMPPKPPP